MKDLFIVANWKSNKTVIEALDWLKKITLASSENKEIIVCPSYTLLSEMSSYIKSNNMPIKLGAQDISPFGVGAYTGAVNAQHIKEFAEYVLIGHSERRNNFKEDEVMIIKKVEQTLTVGLKPIFFAQDSTIEIPQGVQMVVFEPASAISTVSKGVPVSVEDVSRSAGEIRKNESIKYVLYGGSVNDQNVSQFTSLPLIDGVVPGKASLDPVEFSTLIKNA
jgi:triosephosphate isomerase